MANTDSKKCSACGEMTETDAIFCTNCGQRIAEDAHVKICSFCGEAVDKNAAFCTNCGTRFEEKKTQSAGSSSSIGGQLLALTNDFLSVREISPGRFEFSSQTGTQSPVQKIKINYGAVAQLESGRKRLTYWEMMVETSAGMDSGFHAEKTVQKGIEVGKKIHGQLLLGGKYGFEYGKLKDVVKAIAGENGWTFKTSIFKPDISKDKTSQDFWKSMLSMKILIPVAALFFIAVIGSVAYVYYSDHSNVASSHKNAEDRGFAQTGGDNAQIQQIIKTDKDTYDYGERIRVQYLNAPGHSRDWICIVPAGSGNTDAGDYQYIPRRGNGVLVFTSPQPGNYEARAFYRYSPGRYRVTARYKFTVVD